MTSPEHGSPRTEPLTDAETLTAPVSVPVPPAPELAVTSPEEIVPDQPSPSSSVQSVNVPEVMVATSGLAPPPDRVPLTTEFPQLIAGPEDESSISFASVLTALNVPTGSADAVRLPPDANAGEAGRKVVPNARQVIRSNFIVPIDLSTAIDPHQKTGPRTAG